MNYSRYKTFKIMLIAGVTFLLHTAVKAQLLSYTNSTGGALAAVAPHTIGTNLTRVNAVVSAVVPCINGFSSSGFLNTSMYNATAGAIETTIKPASGYVLNVSGFTATLRRNSQGPSKVRFAYSIDGINWVDQLINQTLPNAMCDSGLILNWTVSASVILPNVLRFRIFGFKASGLTGVLQLLNLSINGNVLPVNCVAPANLFANSITASSARLNWNADTAALNYKVNYRKVGSAIWSSLSTVTNSITINELLPATNYQFKVKTTCFVNNSSAFSTSAKFITSNAVVLPVPDHVVILILENHKYSSIIGSTAAPYINALASDSNSALFTQSYGIEHPSQPNYLDLFSGSNQGITNNNIPVNTPFTTPNLARSLQNVSRTFITYSEDLPVVGFNGEYAGAYARKHNPVTNWMGAGVNQVDSTANQPFTAFPVSGFDSLPAVCYVIPNQDNDMHNGNDPTPITIGDNWINTHLNNYIQWAKTHNSLFILTFDEDNGTENNRIATIFTGPMIQAGQYSNHINHFNVLRTLENIYGLSGSGGNVAPIDFCWKTNTPKGSSSSIDWNENNIRICPNPVFNELNINADFLGDGNDVEIRIDDILGNKIFSERYLNQHSTIKITTTNFPYGVYFLKINNGIKHPVIKFIKLQ